MVAENRSLPLSSGVLKGPTKDMDEACSHWNLYKIKPVHEPNKSYTSKMLIIKFWNMLWKALCLQIKEYIFQQVNNFLRKTGKTSTV